MILWATSCSPKTAGYQPYQLEAGAGGPVAGRDPLSAPPRLPVRAMASPGASHRGPGFVDDEANAHRGNAAHAILGLDSRLWPLPPATGAEPNPGVITDEWILSQVVFDEEAEPPIPASVLQVEDGSPLDEAEVPPNQEFPPISPTLPFTALQIEDQNARPAVHPEAAQSCRHAPQLPKGQLSWPTRVVCSYSSRGPRNAVVSHETVS